MPELSNIEASNRDYLKHNKPIVHAKVLKFAEKARKGESIAIIQFQYNYACNLACEHCSVKRFQGKQGGRTFTMQDVRELARQAHELGLAR